MCKLLQITEGPDRGATLHFGDPVKEQRALEAGTAWADLSHLEIVAVKGVDRLRWLHDLTLLKRDKSRCRDLNVCAAPSQHFQVFLSCDKQLKG